MYSKIEAAIAGTRHVPAVRLLDSLEHSKVLQTKKYITYEEAFWKASSSALKDGNQYWFPSFSTFDRPRNPVPRATKRAQYLAVRLDSILCSLYRPQN